MVFYKWETNLAQNPMVQPEPWGITVDVNRFLQHPWYLPKDLKAERSACTVLPYFLFIRRDGRVLYYIGPHSWFIPTTRHYVPITLYDIENEDHERLIREIEFCAKTQCCGFVVQHFNHQLHVSRYFGFGNWIHFQTIWWSSLSIMYNITRSWNLKLWLTTCVLGCLYHYFYKQYYCMYPCFRYKHARDHGRGLMRCESLTPFTTQPYWLTWVLKRQANLLISRNRIRRKMRRQRRLCVLAALLALYRLWFTPELCCIPAAYVPRPPYPFNSEGTGTGYWLPKPGFSGPLGVGVPEMQKWFESRNLFGYFADNCIGLIGLSVASVAILLCMAPNT